MKILVSNDDGYQSSGIDELIKTLSEIAQVVVLAPSVNKSAASSSLSVGKALTPKQVSPNIYHLDGTPSDCVHLALCGFFQEKFDLVVSGINFGANLGDDVIYSGTVAAAIEGRFLGLPSIAVSLSGQSGNYFQTAAMVTKYLVKNLPQSQLSANTILNVNVPDLPLVELKGYQTTRLGKRHASEAMVPVVGQLGSYQIGPNGQEADNGAGTDFYAVTHGFVSVTPLQIDLTHYPEMQPLNQWLKSL